MLNSKSPVSTTKTTVSAPGKVLLAGGYLVLEAPNPGLVIATDKRFYCSVDRSQNGKSAATQSCHIIVKSPQFHSVWQYDSKVGVDSFLLTPSPSNASDNGFVEKTLRVTMAYIWRKQQALPSSLKIVIHADNDFYSVIPHLQERGLPMTPDAVESLPRFLPCPQHPDTGAPIIRKTGLGSSAALVTSMVGALLMSFEVFKQDRAHNLAQICHCYSQGKVGSGFDVSSAVFGSHVYQRFPKCVLSDLLETMSQLPTCLVQSTVDVLEKAVESKWGGGVVEGVDFNLNLLLADVCGGSESPSMARKVLSWKALQNTNNCNQKELYWEELVEINPKIIQLVQMLNRADDDKERQELLHKLEGAFLSSRRCLKAMGEAAGVPIEPAPQTALADATQEIPGVVAAIVPGAGGYDALACVYTEKDKNLANESEPEEPTTKDKIGQLWKTWTGEDGDQVVCPLAVTAGKFGDGLRLESIF
mmetsp:Transcript_22355/g.33027  ORF Transcript_22355/g.33027 Transcript_22355/m.33027 type:complete len:474 (-) Transcript_22355:32-1453(-)